MNRYTPDGGYGLTASQASSLVNTAEVLYVFRTAKRHNVLAREPSVPAALDYLARTLPQHCAPRSSGPARGQKTRYVTYTLLGLCYWPDMLETKHYATIDWALHWLDGHATEEGLPEEAGVGDCSLFQNATAISALTEVLRLPSTSRRSRQRAQTIFDACLKGLLYHALPDSTWPRQTYQERPSPSKTALAAIAIGLAYEAELLNETVTIGGAVREPEHISVEELVSASCDWFAQHTERWNRDMELDPDVTGTQWSHLTYALVLEAVATVGNPTAVEFRSAWHHLLDSWEPGEPGWTEATDPPVPSVRSDYGAVRAFEAVVARHGALALRELRASPPHDRSKRAVGRDLIYTRLGQYSLWYRGDATSQALHLSRRQTELLAALAGGTSCPTFVTARELATMLGLSEGSIGKLIQRLNERVSDQALGYSLVQSLRGHGYRLKVDAIRRSD